VIRDRIKDFCSVRASDLLINPKNCSGSSIVATHQLGRIGYGCEINPEHVAVRIQRLSLLGPRPSCSRNDEAAT